MTPLLLLLIGFLLVFIEFYLPGGLVGIVGGAFIIGSVILFGVDSGSGAMTLLFAIAAIAGTAAVFKFALWTIRRSGRSRSFYLNSDQEGFRVDRYDASLIGKKGAAHTDLKPGGFVIVEGKKYAAVSPGGFISMGSEIVVLALEGETLTVKGVS